MAAAKSRRAKAKAKATSTSPRATATITTKKVPPPLPAKAARAALDRATADIKRLQKSASKNAWTIGRKLVQVAELELHKARGFKSLEQYAESELALSRDSAFLYMRVAQAFSETVAASFGPEKLDRALRYIAATPEDEKPADIPKLKIPVTTADGKVVSKPFTEITIADLRSAVQRERGSGKKAGGKKKPPKWLDGEAASALEAGHTALDKAVGAKAAKTADVTVRRVGEEIVVDVRGVPLSVAAAAFRALSAALK